MNPLDDLFLNAILRVDSNNILFQKEDIKVEYKQFFERDSKDAKAKYAKELAALYNCEGGYLIFGVEDKKSEVVGLIDFSEPDNAFLSGDINTYFSPAFPFIARTFVVNDKTLFIVNVEKRQSTPTVCIKEHPNILSEGTVYWRYSGQSSPIKAGDLINLFNSFRGEEMEKLVAINNTKLKLDYKPYLKYISGHGGNDTIQLKIANEGERAMIEQVRAIEGFVTSHSFLQLPAALAKKDQFNIQVKRNDSLVVGNISYKLEFIFSDVLKTKYMAIGNFTGLVGTIGEPEEI